MKNIGKYNGVPCYECTNVEWKDRYDRGQDNGKQIFIIDGVMVRNNKIVGHYDGKHVTDRYDEQPYYVEIKVDNYDVMNMRKKAETADNVSYEEVVAKEIHFSDYSHVVDEFFALLEK
jgi:hypothetical protein